MKQENLDLILNYARNFLGYGNLNAPFWFVGMEEAGVQNPDQAVGRAQVWNRLGNGHTVDLFDYSQQLGAVGERERCFIENPYLDPRRWFREHRPPTQPTWRPLIRFLMAVENQSHRNDGTDIENVRTYQRNNWGRVKSNNCLLEIFGLPQAASGSWAYADVPRIATRKLGITETFKQRSQALQGALRRGMNNGTLKIVLFYGGVNKIKNWSEVCGITNWSPATLLGGKGEFLWSRLGPALFLGIAHPARGKIGGIQAANFVDARAEWVVRNG